MNYYDNALSFSFFLLSRSFDCVSALRFLHAHTHSENRKRFRKLMENFAWQIVTQTHSHTLSVAEGNNSGDESVVVENTEYSNLTSQELVESNHILHIHKST